MRLILFWREMKIHGNIVHDPLPILVLAMALPLAATAGAINQRSHSSATPGPAAAIAPLARTIDLANPGVIRLFQDLGERPHDKAVQEAAFPTLWELRNSPASLPKEASLSLAQAYAANTLPGTMATTAGDVLASQPELPEKAVKVLIEGLTAFGYYKKKQVVDILGYQNSLADSSRAPLEKALKSPDPDTRIAAAHLILAADPKHQSALGTVKRRAAQLYGKASFDFVGEKTCVDNIWTHIAPSPENAIASSRRLYSELALSNPDQVSRAVFERMISRLTLYTNYPRRMMKVLRDAFPSYISDDGTITTPATDSYINSLMPDPEAQREKDFQFKQQVLYEIRNAVRTNLDPSGSGNVVGILVVGSLATHPTPGSDIDVIFVTRDGHNGDVWRFSEDLFSALDQAGFGNHADRIRMVRHGSLDFKRELALGAQFIDR